ncbi:M48 family metallopeptidase [Roseovarius salinarum]|uniref:M48 family metallopeptidase n=1 Tax=Roseovarius salinarum TaxID=1981892 RepID=UPI000C345EB0|nr:SprT family zinc-dependent metalloprotease [Roseovarius salinarum]
MRDHLLPGEPPVALTLRRSSRARRISLRVSGLDGRVTLTVPTGVREAEALDFARSKAGWLRDRLRRQPGRVRVAAGAEVPYRGEGVRITPADGRRVRLHGDTLLVPGDADGTAARVRAFLREQARARLAAASDRHASALGRAHGRITLRDTRSRWGSCSSAGRLMYSWRLIMAPDPVLDYVAAHEVAHLEEMNHSPAFWRIVADLCPGFDGPRRWLRENGAALHRYDFGD